MFRWASSDIIINSMDSTYLLKGFKSRMKTQCIDREWELKEEKSITTDWCLSTVLQENSLKGIPGLTRETFANTDSLSTLRGETCLVQRQQQNCLPGNSYGPKRLQMYNWQCMLKLLLISKEETGISMSINLLLKLYLLQSLPLQTVKYITSRSRFEFHSWVLRLFALKHLKDCT